MDHKVCMKKKVVREGILVALFSINLVTSVMFSSKERDVISVSDLAHVWCVLRHCSK